MKHEETEIKLRARDAQTAHALLLAHGFAVSHERTFEANILLDTSTQDLRAGRRTLRLREYGPRRVLTYKGSPVVDKHKSREELETVFPTDAPLEQIFERLGFTPQFRYEKYRTEYLRAGEEGVATLDETPIGTFLELEGEPDWIDRMAREMGFGEADYITKSYVSLYTDWAAEHGGNPAGMVFGEGGAVTQVE